MRGSKEPKPWERRPMIQGQEAGHQSSRIIAELINHITLLGMAIDDDDLPTAKLYLKGARENIANDFN